MKQTPTSPVWWITNDGDPVCNELYNRHYSSSKSKPCRLKRDSKLFAGPGEKIVLRTWDGDAVFVWRRNNEEFGRKWHSGEGVQCSMFRNESQWLSSELIRQADAIADFCWPSLRHYTYVEARRIRSANAGCCFKIAGYTVCGKTSRGLLILERPCRWSLSAHRS